MQNKTSKNFKTEHCVCKRLIKSVFTKQNLVLFGYTYFAIEKRN